jgi:ABC-2 type transport system ATP-binding protein
MRHAHAPNTCTVSVDRLTIKFGDFTAVNDISFSVSRGETFGFLGANGAGKTTTIRTLCGLQKPTSGKVLIAGSSFEDGATAIKTKVGYMSQKLTLYEDLTVSQNFDFSASLRRIDRTTLESRKRSLFEFISFEKPQKTLVRDLPGGIKQQVSLIATLLHDPEIVFLDEPTAGVAPAARAAFWKLIKALAEQGKTIFVTSHYMDEVEMCDRIALMRSGSIVAMDSPRGIKQSTFPEGIIELDPIPGSAPASSWLQSIQGHRSIASLTPHGLRYHVIVQDKSLWASELVPQLSRFFIIKNIPPSLDDVFIRLVEEEAK